MDLSSEDEVLKVNRFGSDHISGGKSWATALSWEASVFFFQIKALGTDMDVSKNNGTPKSSILIGFSIIFTIHFGGTPIFGNIHMNR